MIANRFALLVGALFSIFLQVNGADGSDRLVKVTNQGGSPITLYTEMKTVGGKPHVINPDQTFSVGRLGDLLRLSFVSGTSISNMSQLQPIDFKLGALDPENQNKNVSIVLSPGRLWGWHVVVNWEEPLSGGAQIPVSKEPAGFWHDITLERQDVYKDENAVVRKALFYSQTPIKSYESIFELPRVVLFVFHGTFAAGDPQFYSVDDDTFQALKKYAASLGKNAELVSIGWSGDNEDSARKNAFQFVKTLFNKLYLANKNIFTQINVLGYSHGGNIVNLITQDEDLAGAIHNIISIFTPVREDYPVNLSAITGKLYHFYSTGDVVQYMGSFESADCSYQSIYPWIQKLSSLPKLSFGGFAGGRKVATILDDIVEQKALNFRVMINGHSPSHLNILPIVNNLPLILREVQRIYRYSFDFELNIDTQRDAVDIAIRRQYAPEVIERVASEEIQAQLERERGASSAAEQSYLKKYGADIHGKSPFCEFLYSPFVSKAEPGQFLPGVYYPTFLAETSLRLYVL